MVCCLSTKENVHYDPPVLLHGCGSQARFGVLCIYMECSTYIWSTPYINIWTITPLFMYVALLLYIEHYIYIYTYMYIWIMAFMEHSIYINGAVHFYVEYSICYIWSTTFIYGRFFVQF